PSSKRVNDQSFIPSPDLQIHDPVLGGTPVPVQHILIVLPEKIPLHPVPDGIDLIAQVGFSRVTAVEIFTSYEQSFYEIRSFTKVGAIIIWADGNRGPGCAIFPVGEGSVISCAIIEEEVGNFQNTIPAFSSGNIISVHSSNNRHNTKAGAASSN